MSRRMPPRERGATRRDLLRHVRAAIARGEIPPEAEQEALDRLDSAVKRFALTRRELLKATAASGLTLIAVDAFTRSAEAKSILAATPSLTTSVLRREDMLALRFDLDNLVRNNQGDLVRQSAAQPAYIVATLGYGADHAPQNIGEQAFLVEQLEFAQAPCHLGPAEFRLRRGHEVCSRMRVRVGGALLFDDAVYDDFSEPKHTADVKRVVKHIEQRGDFRQVKTIKRMIHFERVSGH